MAYVLLGLAGALAEVRSIEDTLALAVRTVPEFFGGRRAFAAQWEPEDDSFWITATWGVEGAAADDLRAKAQDGPASFPFLLRAMRERQPILVAGEEPHPEMSIVAIPLVRWGMDFGGLRVEIDGVREFTARDISLAQGIARQVGVALDNARRFNLLQGLSRFSERIGLGSKRADVLNEILQGAVDLLQAEGAWLYFLDESHSMLSSFHGRSETLALPERLAKLDLAIEPWAGMARSGTIAVADVSAQFGRSDLTALAAPLRAGPERLIGCVLVVYEQGHPFGAEDIEALNVLSGQAAQAIENTRRFDRERAVARSLQSGLLSSDLPSISGFTTGAIYEAADEEAEVGGDFYDVLDLPDGRFGVVVGDVSGKGAAAAAQMAMVKYMLRAFAIRNPQPGSVLHHLNNALVRELPEDRFTTLMYAVLDPAERTCSLTLAGHPTPLLYRARTGEVEAIEATGTILGAFEDQTFGHVTLPLEEGDMLVAYTDGLLEARRGDDLYGRPRIEDSLRSQATTGPPASAARRMYEDARAFGRVTDDTVILTLFCDRST